MIENEEITNTGDMWEGGVMEGGLRKIGLVQNQQMRYLYSVNSNSHTIWKSF